MTSVPEKILIRLRMHGRVRAFRRAHRRQLRSLLSSAPVLSGTCPICSSNKIVEFVFHRVEGPISKEFCTDCEHLFSNYLQTDPALASQLFKVSEENEAKEAQANLLVEVATRSNLADGRYLDFGVGGNIAAFQEVARRFPGKEFMGCDVYSSGVPAYFMTYDPAARLGTFDGISSYAVVEHLTGTLETWRLFNQLLKPVSKGGGLMVHSFPSQLHNDFEHWAVQILSHTCVFSRESLKLTCEATGFRLVESDPERPVGPHYHPVCVFEKVRDV